jgi:hypothetical protein
MGDLDELRVYGQTAAGWCAATLPNETTDELGRVSATKAREADPRAPGRRAYDDPEVQRLREHLRQNNGLFGLEIVDPNEVDRAARIFFRDGFVVVRNLLTGDELAGWREGCARVLRKILEIPGTDGRKYATETGRLPHRYSYGTASASRELLHEPEWVSKVDLPTTTPILTKLFGTRDYLLRGAGGDLCLPGAIEYQALHSDTRETFEMTPARLRVAEQAGVELRRDESGELTYQTRELVLRRAPPHITINFFMSDLTWENGPIRQISGTQTNAAKPPTPEDEPEWMRLATLVGAKAGDGVFRDNRAWHGATPNLSREIRAMPNVEYCGPWVPEERFWKSMPHEIWETLSPHAQAISRVVKSPPGVWPSGAGVMHPLAAKRKEAKVR